MATRLAADQRWNLEDIFPRVSEWETALEALGPMVEEVSSHKGRLGQGPEHLLAALEACERLHAHWWKVNYYARLCELSDYRVAEYQGLAGRVRAAGADVHAAFGNLVQEIAEIPKEKLLLYVGNCPELADFQATLDEGMNMANHSLHPEAERVLGELHSLLESPRRLYERIAATEFQVEVLDGAGQRVPVSLVDYERARQSPDRTFRVNTHTAVAKELGRRRVTLAGLLDATVLTKVALSRLRGFEYTEEPYLMPDIPQDLYHKVLRVTHDCMAPHVRNLTLFRKKALCLDNILYCDLHAPLAQHPAGISFAQAYDVIRESLQPMGSEYIKMVDQAFSGGWIDARPASGRPPGSFCAAVYGVHPYISIHWNNNLRDAFTLAHEVGHALHSMLSMSQRSLNNNVQLPFAEIPALVNELLLGMHLLRSATDPSAVFFVRQQLSLTFIEHMVARLLQAKMEYSMYRAVEDGRPLSADWLCSNQETILNRFFIDSLQLDDGARLSWATVPHYYVGCYLYTYPLGLACAYAIASRILSRGKPSADEWLAVLSAGSSRSPFSLVRMAGVDPNSSVIEDAAEFFGRIVADIMSD